LPPWTVSSLMVPMPRAWYSLLSELPVQLGVCLHEDSGLASVDAGPEGAVGPLAYAEPS
jgi:hypothetical protein